jgi:type VI secretion system FHA domain protein
MIRIEVQSRGGEAVDAPAVEFDEQGGTIGRAKESTLVLDDPNKYISRRQAFISFRGGACFLRDNGTALPTLVNGNAIGKDNEVAVRDGDQIGIGDYTLAVRALRASIRARSRDEIPDPFADRVRVEPFLSRAALEVIPPDFDRLREPGERRAVPQEPENDELGIIRPPAESLDTLFGLKAPGFSDALDHVDPLVGSLPQPAADKLIPDFGFSPPRTPVQQRDDVHILSTSIPVPEPCVPAAQAPVNDGHSAPHESSQAQGEQPHDSGTDADTEALLRAFIAGTGVDRLQLPRGLTPEVMNQIGQLLREAVRGTLELLVARAVVKREIRARDITILVARENNPLKHSITPEAALAKLLGPEAHGFMPAVAAMRDAYRDLRSHQFGVMAGMRAALAGVLERFDPARLEERIQQRGTIDAFISGGRKARLWEMFERLYTDISREAEDDFETLFGKAFLKAYEAQIAKLKQED